MHTERLHLRRPRVDDLEAFLAYRNDPANLRLQPIEPMAYTDALQFLLAQSGLDRHADNCWIMFSIERLRDSRMIGEVGIYLESAVRHAGDIGWSLHRDACGQGYAIEAARRLVDYAFGERQLLRLTASMSAHNEASLRLCERLGMCCEATASEAQCVDGDWHDVHQYGLSRSDWAGLRGLEG
jgi:ribosomal-protein-alanine N-acetyltransferase